MDICSDHEDHIGLVLTSIRLKRLLLPSLLGFLYLLFKLFHDPHDGCVSAIQTPLYKFVLGDKLARDFPCHVYDFNRFGSNVVLAIQIVGPTQCLLSHPTRSFHEVVFFINDMGLFLCC